MNSFIEKHREARRDRRDHHPKCKKMQKYAVGVIVILAGLVLLSTNTGFLPYSWREVIFSWQMLLITIGVVSLMGRESYIPGIILVLIGGIFIIPKFAFLPFSVHNLFWPAILIAFGLIILFKGFKKPFRSAQRNDLRQEDGYINEEAIFGGSKQIITHKNFKGGRISCVFGGAEIDLMNAELAPGEHTLTISAIFGGATVIVPADWKVVFENSSIFGGFDDKRRVVKENVDPSKVLIIKAEAIFGGGELKSY